MTDFYVLPAYVFENAQVVSASGKKDAAEAAAERDGTTAGRVAVIPADAVTYKTIELSTSLQALDS